jgi:hypothetical protein
MQDPCCAANLGRNTLPNLDRGQLRAMLAEHLEAS